MYTLVPQCSFGCSTAEWTANFAAAAGAPFSTFYSGGTTYVNAIEICTDQTIYVVIDTSGTVDLTGYTGTSAAHDHTPDTVILRRSGAGTITLLFNNRVDFSSIKMVGGGTAPNLLVTGYIARETDFSV